ncbi:MULTISPECIES: hypothetical protein [unclassified Paenibacillus]|uniref:hypothetical protein n=1 Tax=unclassified Paenibacillus TaxID=185978 RepID=UPI002407411E|nr:MULTISPECIES: hypothetical protein [unclassified Paenibacillus]MDF9843531.1 hypothetical protein [Paenibacillus sp. PastF-2]MDF9850119.1 hypothetical protein [Paenibacillus sp. PastM-2]MDF9857139.1 hypothetical protein [Paenibacillus sp. PastF-1]MDH6482410.1 hypothetical protein [Paenibacillus sp. PastH-2]MDH6509252.1 hypothetical protein [Paenibacillus sp. PastM-3]
MSKKGVGVILLMLGVISYIIRESLHYLAAVSLSFKLSGISNTMIAETLSLIPPPYAMTVPIVLIIIGIIYLVWSEIEKK